MRVSVYRAQIKHIERTVASFTNDSLPAILKEVEEWRNTPEAIEQRVYSLFIQDQDNNNIFTSIV